MNYEFLSRTFLFQGTSPEETKHMLSCLKATPQSYAKGSTIWQVGDQVKTMGLVLNGSVHIENIDMMGNKSILNRIAPGQVFGETYACIPGEKLLIGVTAAEDCQILFLEVGKIFRTCPDTCPCHEKLIHNMLMVMAKKNLELSRRSLHTAPKSIRGRLLSYFSQEMVQQGSSRFTIPFNRQELADYLGVDRTTYVKYETDKSEPTFDTLQKLADYFGVTVDFLMGRDTIEKPAATMDDELNEYLEELKNREDMRMLFSLAKGATKEDVMQAVKIIEALRDK